MSDAIASECIAIIIHCGLLDNRSLQPNLGTVTHFLVMMMMLILISLSKRNGIIKLDDTSPTRSVGIILVYCGILLHHKVLFLKGRTGGGKDV